VEDAVTAVKTSVADQVLDPELVAELTAPLQTSSRRVIDVITPVNGQLLASVPESTREDVVDSFAAARLAQRSWAGTSISERKSIMLRLHDLLLAHRDEILDLAQWETGKARRDALEEVLDVCINARHYARDAQRLLQPKRHRGAFPLIVGVEERRLPKGVVGIIAPWNYPITLAASDAIPALMAGNTVVLKPDSQTLLTALWLVGLMHRAGVPEDAIQVVAGSGSALGKTIVAESDYLMFTGSTRVGSILAAQCGEQLIGCSMELGGKNAMVVTEDIDIDKAVDIVVRGCFANAGQLCVSMERLYVQREVWDRFVPALTERVEQLQLAVGVGWGAEMGSLISAEHLANVENYVTDAVSRGATVLTGGQPRPDVGPFVYEPTILTDVTEEMALCREETFGPVVSLYPYDEDEAAIDAANDTVYGLNAAVLCRNKSRAKQIAVQLRAGTVNINEGYAATWGATRAPMGGMGDSGLGRRHGDEGLLKYTEVQTIAVQRALGYGPQFGLSDQRWGEVLSSVVGLFKRVGLK
jgi:succinate-semialdehyde dehydrogenase/glutarate-semialdehyde dehydrogenase